MEEQGEMIALRLQGKYQLYLNPQSTGEHQLVIGSLMHHCDSAPVTHQALACMMPALVSQPLAGSILLHDVSDFRYCSTFLTAVLTYWEELNSHADITLSSLAFWTWPPRYILGGPTDSSFS